MSQSSDQPVGGMAAVDQPKPDRLAAGFKILVGLAFGAATYYLFDLHTKQTPSTGAGVMTGIAMGLGVWLLLSGIMPFMGKQLPRFVGPALLVICAVAMGMAEPKIVTAMEIRKEEEGWAQLQASPKTFEDYQRYQFSSSAPRKDISGPRALARVKSELERLEKYKGARVATLRRVMQECWNERDVKNPATMQPAMDLVKEELAKSYAKGLEDLAKSTGTGKREFPEDPQMRAAFAAILTRLAKSDDDSVYLSFVSKNEIKADNAAAEKLISPGDAFSADRDSMRYRMFANSLEDCLKSAFTEPLVNTRTLGDKAERKGKVVFEVQCTSRRAPGYFELTRDGKATGRLLNMEVEWDFVIFDVDGKELARNHSKSNPADSFRFRSKAADPAWAPYSVMMDSTYYNYCREVAGRLGMKPPAAREYFSFQQ